MARGGCSPTNLYIMTVPAAPQPAKTKETYAPGLMVRVRDELWLITNVTQSVDGYLLKVRGLSDYVRDTTASFYTAIDDVEVFDPAKVEVVADDSPGYRTTRLWLETTLRQTPVPLYQEELSVAEEMLMDPLDYQLTAVKKALSDDNLRPRVLIADAVGLGKTLEIGMILAELIRRGRGDRILVVTPKHIMEQFQQEMWSRFAIPLVRLDSAGIQRVRRILPASRNPFTYFSRVIVSMDTLKSPKYRAQLEKVRWDAVVMDEIHNATNVGTQNNELARTLAPTTEALLLASATPHNGDPESFKEILRLLDPTSVMPDGTIDKNAVNRLLIRRHRHSEEVANVVGEKWAVRKDPLNIPVEASAEENAVAGELESTWVHPESGQIPAQDRLFPWTLVKAFLSSPAALGETINNRLKRVPTSDTKQREALERLQKLNQAVTRQNSNKYAALINYLKEIGVGKGKATRAVVFSERVATLNWLQENLTKDLKMPQDSIAVMHGGLSDEEQMRLVDEFKREDSKLRVLVTGDVASEGVNLHTLCHHLIHYDIPWSLIRIQQRNGRVDRYGQTEQPQIAALLLDTKQGGYVGELHVLKKLIEREHEAHEILGDVGSLIGKHSVTGEEDEIRRVIQNQVLFDDVVKTPEQLSKEEPLSESDLIDQFLAGFGFELDEDGNDISEEDDATYSASMPHSRGSLYSSEIEYLEDALSEAFHGAPEKELAANGVGYVRHQNQVAELTPPEDLRRRLDILPQDYLADRKVRERFQLATNTDIGNEIMRRARTGQDGSTWPKAHFLGPLHPVTDWATDRALASLSAGQITAINGDVPAATVLLMATLTNKRGQVVSRAFVAVMDGMIPQDVPDPITWLRSIGLTEDAINPGTLEIPENAHDLIAKSVQVATGQLQPMMAAARDHAHDRIGYWIQRANDWNAAKKDVTTTARVGRSASLIDEEKALIASLEPDRELIRPLVLILPQEA